MKITEPQRADLETCLDRLMLLASKNPDYRAADGQLYERAVASVREIPEGRRMRSDFNRRRPTPNLELPVA